MSDNTPRIDPDSLVLRGRPRRVVRFKRHVVIGVAAIACIAILGATWLALRGTNFHHQSGDQDIGTGDKSMPDALAGLPKSYDQLKPPPKLGPPLPGDLGPPVVHQEQNLGLRPNPEDDAVRAERMRLARQAHEAMEAGVFFPLTKGESIANLLQPAVQAKGQGDNGTAITPAAASGDKLNLDPRRDPDDQQRKLDFLNRTVESGIYNPHSLQNPVSPCEVLAGTVISASLVTGLNSDLPGEVIAQVTENVYDTVTGRILLIPQGARLIGTYDSVVAFGQSRALVVWQRIIMPNGTSVQVDNLPATDTAGYAGLADQVDYHTWSLLKGIALSTLLGVGSQLTFGNQQNDLIQAIAQSAQNSTAQADQSIVERELNIQPTITVRPGWPLRVIVHKDLVLRPYGT
jgi:type IV secretion system protein VirB10